MAGWSVGQHCLCLGTVFWLWTKGRRRRGTPRDEVGGEAGEEGLAEGASKRGSAKRLLHPQGHGRHSGSGQEGGVLVKHRESDVAQHPGPVADQRLHRRRGKAQLLPVRLRHAACFLSLRISL